MSGASERREHQQVCIPFVFTFLCKSGLKNHYNWAGAQLHPENFLVWVKKNLSFLLILRLCSLCRQLTLSTSQVCGCWVSKMLIVLESICFLICKRNFISKKDNRGHPVLFLSSPSIYFLSFLSLILQFPLIKLKPNDFQLCRAQRNTKEDDFGQPETQTTPHELKGHIAFHGGLWFGGMSSRRFSCLLFSG